jgi:hypothetical protein
MRFLSGIDLLVVYEAQGGGEGALRSSLSLGQGLSLANFSNVPKTVTDVIS